MTFFYTVRLVLITVQHVNYNKNTQTKRTYTNRITRTNLIKHLLAKFKCIQRILPFFYELTLHSMSVYESSFGFTIFLSSPSTPTGIVDRILLRS